MAIQTIHRLSCPSCGAPLPANVSSQRVTCSYCGTRLLIETAPATAQVPATIRARPEISQMATISLVFGVAAWLILPLVGAIVAVLAGHRARADIAAARGHLAGITRATIGLILGYAQLAMAVLFVLSGALQGRGIP